VYTNFTFPFQDNVLECTDVNGQAVTTAVLS